MNWKIWLADVACGIGLAYVSAFAGAILKFAGSIRARARGPELQDAVTPPWVAMLAILVFLVSMVTLAAGFLMHGPYIGCISILVVSACVLGTHRWLPREDSAYYKSWIIRAMSRRYAGCVRKNDLLRAAVFKDLLGSAGISVQ